MSANQNSSIAPGPIALTVMIVLAALSRILPHPFNFTPIEAMALFGAAYYANRALSIAVPLLAMLLADFFLGFHSGMPVIYGTIIVISILGFALRGKVTPLRVASFGLVSATLFFLITNFAVWLEGSMYPMNMSGLLACYIAGIPFFHWQLAGVATYSVILFGGFALLRSNMPALKSQTV
ncbi:MAG: DUF6580 family putative transport protein [Arenimonas sp.]